MELCGAIGSDYWPLLNFKESVKKGQGSQPGSRSAPESESETDLNGDPIRCRACGHTVTTHKQRLTVQGAHVHTFANPHGLVFEIACFEQAPGCLQVGPPSDEFTWFAGYHWRVVVCRGCLTHLGWHFAGRKSAEFYGLIMAHLLNI